MWRPSPQLRVVCRNIVRFANALVPLPEWTLGAASDAGALVASLMERLCAMLDRVFARLGAGKLLDTVKEGNISEWYAAAARRRYPRGLARAQRVMGER